MNRLYILIFALMFCIIGHLAAILPDFTKGYNPALYQKLHGKAIENIAKLPKPQQKQYHALLERNNDILMAYLLAYESDANLSQADPNDILSNYHEIAQLLEADGLKYSPEFFLSYVAKQTVSDERISAYRKALLEDGLASVLQITDPTERYRATASWCVEKLQFQQTSGRDQNPLDICMKSLVGRCEEMQILFVAAARVVGLPSRPASTPWWAHMDNNHAWAEVFLGGKWMYTGDMDSAYFPNQTWFSGMIDKTVMILADGSLAAENDEVLYSGKYDLSINSTANYAGERTRKIQIQLQDLQGNPIPEAQCAIMVFNWGALRPLSYVNSDKDGKLSFSAGRGAFYLSAFKDGKKALYLIESSADSVINATITLSEQDIASQNTLLIYPSNQMTWQEAPQAYRDDIEKRKAIWRNTVSEYHKMVNPKIVADSLSYQTAILCKGNVHEFLAFYSKHKPKAEFLDFLQQYDPKFLWQADRNLFEAVYLHWLANPKDEDYPLVVYYPTVHYEELPIPINQGNKGYQLYPQSFLHPANTERQCLKKAMAWQKKTYKINAKKALNGLIPLHIAVKQKFLNSYQYRILAINVLRANGIAAEFTRIPDNILAFIDNDWHYYNVLTNSFEESKAESANQAITLHIQDDKGIPLHIGSEQLTLNRYVDGVFYSLNTEFEYKGNGNYTAIIPGTDLYLHFGYRISDSETAFQMYPISSLRATSTVDVDSSDIHIEIVAKQYPRTWNEADDAILTLFSDEILDQAEVIVLGNFDQENSLRVIDKLKAESHKYLFYGYGENKMESSIYQPLASWQELVAKDSSNTLRTITLIKKGESWKMYEGLWEKLP